MPAALSLLETIVNVVERSGAGDSPYDEYLCGTDLLAVDALV